MKLTLQDLEVQGAELLPAREALQTNDLTLDAINVAAAVNFESHDAAAKASASQLVAVEQD